MRVAPYSEAGAMRRGSAIARIREGRGRGRGAFTIVELVVVLLVLLVLALLVLFLPLGDRISPKAWEGRRRARVSELAMGAAMYAKDNRGLYPGQAYPDMLVGNGGPLTGSQVLMCCLFGYSYGGNPVSGWNILTADANLGMAATTGYAPYWPEDMLIIAGRPGTAWDRQSRTARRAICYYPARVGVTGMQQYVEADNTAYTTGAIWAGSSFHSYIADRRADPNTPVNNGSFLLIGAGMDGAYGTGDDAKNF